MVNTLQNPVFVTCLDSPTEVSCGFHEIFQINTRQLFLIQPIVTQLLSTVHNKIPISKQMLT